MNTNKWWRTFNLKVKIKTYYKDKNNTIKMNNINNFFDFKRFKKLNEEATAGHAPFKTTHGSGSYNAGQDTFFANVHGNLAGAENTLVGSAVIKLIGFIKRKGMEIYMKSVLKPRLGRILLNGILRYAIKNNLRNLTKKEWFGIKKIVNDDEVPFENKVSFSKDNETGLSKLIVGATVKTEKDIPKLDNGKYMCLVNGVEFDVENNIIISVGGTATTQSTTSTQTTQPQQEPQSEENASVPENLPDDEIKKAKDDFEKSLIESSVGIEPSDDIKKDIEYLKSVLKDIELETSKSGLSKENIKIISDLEKKLNKDITILKKEGIDVIDELLKNEKIADKLQLQVDKQQYLTDVKSLIDFREMISDFTNKYGVGTVNVTESLITEATANVNVSDTKIKANKPKVSRFGDELKELSDKGESIDLNNENFYKQFETPAVRKAVADEILTDRPSLVKLQLTAENLIAGGNSDKNRWKLDNTWKKTVEDVLGLYSKFVNTEFVNPYKIVKETNKDDIDKYKTMNNRIGNDGKTLQNFNTINSLSDNKLFTDSTTLIKDLNKIDKNDYCILNISFRQDKVEQTDDYYVLRRMTPYKDSLKIFRVLGKIDLKSINSEFKESDFSSLIKKQYNKIILPTDINEKNLDSNFKALRGIYIAADTQGNFNTGIAPNKISILYLFSDNEKIDWNNKGTYYFKIKVFKGNGLERILDDKFVDYAEDKGHYKINMFIDNTLKYKISSIDSFSKFIDYEIMKVSNVFETFKKYFSVK